MDLSHPTAKKLEPGQEVYTFGGILDYAARTFPDKAGVICNEDELTFAEMDAFANRFATMALAETGAHEKIGLFMRNCAEYTIAHFGAGRTGRVTVHFSPRFSDAELLETMNMTKPGILVVDSQSYKTFREVEERLEHTPHLISIDPVEGLEKFWDTLEGVADGAPAIEVRADDEASIIFTGGTTGHPKAALVTQRARAISAITAVEDFRIEPEEICAVTVPLCHTAGLYTWYQPTVLAGCTAVVLEKWDVPKFQQACAEHGITSIFAVPAQLALMFDHPDFDPDSLKSVERMTFGGAPLSRSLIERAAEIIPWIDMQRAYGSTETGHMMAQIPSDREVLYEGWNQPGGRLEIDVFDNNGRPAAFGEAGEIVTRGPHVMKGYLDNEDANSEFFRDADPETPHDRRWGWTGDLGIKHEQGYITLAGRAKDMILSGGLNIFPAEIEERLLRHPSVADAAVFPVEDGTWGELPAAAVVLEEGASPDEEELIIYMKELVSRYKRPRRVLFVEAIPYTPAGKIDRKELIELYGDTQLNGGGDEKAAS